jgi:hypothetical protein
MEGEHYNSRIRGINIDLGDNPTVSGISMSGAQQCRCMHRQLRSLVNMSAMFIALDRLAQSTSCACSEGVMVALACMHDILNVLVPLTQFKWTRFTPSCFRNASRCRSSLAHRALHCPGMHLHDVASVPCDASAAYTVQNHERADTGCACAFSTCESKMWFRANITSKSSSHFSPAMLFDSHLAFSLAFAALRTCLSAGGLSTLA